jgi:hypothetical protein
MKTRLLLLIAFLQVATLFATAPAPLPQDSNPVSVFESEHYAAYINELKHTLTNGAWQQLDDRFWNGFRMLFEFKENGQVLVLCQQPGEWPAYQDYQWSVSANDEQVTLTLTNKTGQQLQYLLITTSKGMDLAPMNNNRSKIETKFIPALPESAMAQLRRHFIGVWENNLVGGSTHMVHCEFYADGTYSRILSTDNHQAGKKEQGRWSFSKDGGILLLVDNHSNHVECVRIKLIQSDEMVLQETVTALGVQSDAQPRNLYFSKL